ncbi:MAG: hypothetical protein V1886_01850 [archaeon]
MAKISDSLLEKLKNDYEKFRKKYNLPGFQQLNEEFEIERIAEHETDLLLREIRKAITEKAVAFLRFLELMINPSAAPFFLLSVIKHLNASDKKVVNEIYRNVCDFEIKAIALDMKYSEKAEVEFIKYASGKWQKMHPDLQELSRAIDKAWNASFEKKERSYFG